MIVLVFLLFLIFLPGAWGNLSFTVYWPERPCPLEPSGPYTNPFPDGFEVWTEGDADVWTYPDSPRLESLTLDPVVAGRSLSNNENLYYDPETDAYVFTIRAKVASGITSASYPTGTYLVPIFSAGQSNYVFNPRVNGQLDFLPGPIPWNSCHTLDWYKGDPTAIDPVEQSGHWVGFTLIVPRSSTLIFNAEGVAIDYNPDLLIDFDWFLVAVGAGDQGQDYVLARGYVDSINFIVTNQPEDIPEPPTPTPTPTLTKTPTPTFIPPTDTPTIPPTETPTPKQIKDLAVVGLKVVSHPSFVVVQGATFYFVAEVRNLGDVNFSGDVVVSATNMTTLDALGEHTIEGGISTLSRSKFLPFQIHTESLAQGSYQVRIKHDQTDDDPSNDTYTFYMGVLAPTPTPTPSPTHTYTPTSTPSPTFTPANTPVPGAVDIAVVRLKADSLEVVQGDNQPVYAEVRNEGSVVSSNFILSATNVTNGTSLGTYEISSLAPGFLVPERGWLFPSAGLDPGEYEVQVSHNYNSYGHSPADEVPGNDMASIVLTVVTPTPTPTNTPSPTSTPTPTETPSPTATATPWTGHYDIAALYILGATELVYPGDKGVYSACFINRGDIVSSTFYVTVENWTKGGEIIHYRLITETLETNQLFSVGFQLKSWELTPNILYRIHAQHWLSTDEVPENDQMDLFVYVVQPPTPTPVWAPPTRLPEIILPTPTPTREWSPPRTPTPTPTRSTPTPTASFTPRPTFTPTRTPYPLPTCDPVLPVCDYNGPPRLPPELEAINMAFRDLGLSAVAWSCHGLFDMVEIWDWLKMGGNLSVGGDALICGDLLVHGMINGVTVADLVTGVAYPSFGVMYDGDGRSRQAVKPMDELGIISTDGFVRIVLDSRTGYWNILRGPNAETSAGGEQAVATPWGPPTATPTPAVLVIEDDRGVTLEQPLDQPLRVHSWPGGNGYIFVHDDQLNVYAPPIPNSFVAWNLIKTGQDEKHLWAKSPWDWLDWEIGHGLVAEVTDANHWSLSVDVDALGLGTAAMRDATDTVAYNAELPDGAAIIDYINGLGFITDPNDSVQPSELDGTFSTIGLLKRLGAGSYTTVPDNSANWDQAFGWGNHATQGYLKTYNPNDSVDASELEVLFGPLGAGLMIHSASGQFNVTPDNHANWDTAYSWGNHATQGYLKSYNPNDSVSGAELDAELFDANGILIKSASGTFSTTPDNHANWDTAYGWGNHANAGYLKPPQQNDSVDASELEVLFGPLGAGLMVRSASGVFGTTTDNHANWDTAYTERRQWDGGPTNLDAETGRNSLGLGSAALSLATDFALKDHNHGTGTEGTLAQFTGTDTIGDSNLRQISSGALVAEASLGILREDPVEALDFGNNLRLRMSTDKTHLDQSSLIRLQWTSPAGKPAIGWFDEGMQRRAAIVAHHYLTYPTDLHQHLSLETSDSAGALQTRLEIPWGGDVVDIETHSANFKVAGGGSAVVTSGTGSVMGLFGMGTLYPASAGDAHTALDKRGFIHRSADGTSGERFQTYIDAYDNGRVCVLNSAGVPQVQLHSRAGKPNYFLQNTAFGKTSALHVVDVSGTGSFTNLINTGSLVDGQPTHLAVQTGDSYLKWQTWGSFVNNLALEGQIGGGNVGGTGSTGYIAKWIASATLANSVLYESSSKIGVGMTPSYTLDVNGETRTTKLNLTDTFADKILLKGSLYRINIDSNEMNLFSDRYFTLSSDTNTDAFIFDADTGSLTSEGNIIINGIYYGDGSGLNYVDADTLEGRSGNDFVERIGDSMYGDLDMTTAKVIFDVSPDIKISFGNPYRIETRSNTLVFRTDNKFLFENGTGFPVLEMNHSEDEIIAYTNLNLSSKNINDVNKAKVNSIVFRTARTEATASQLLAALEDGEMVLWKPSGGPLALAVKYGTNDLRWQNLITAAGAEDWPEDVHALGIEYDGTVYRAQVHTGY